MIRYSTSILAVTGLALGNPAFAAGATRSADSLPVLTATGSVLYTRGIEERWRCIEVTDEELGLDEDGVQVDELGNVIVNAAGEPFRCRPSAGAAADGGGFPFEILLGTIGLGGLIGALSGGGSDSPG